MLITSVLNTLDSQVSFGPLLKTWVRSLDLTTHSRLTNMAWVRARLCKLQKSVHSTRSRKW